MFKNVIKMLKENNKTISTMESCTGGAVVNEITNLEGASKVLKFSAVTYSNEFKVKMGVSKDVIDKFTVYSDVFHHYYYTIFSCIWNVLNKKISDFTGSDYGIGVTGRINRIDEANLVGGDDSIIYVSIYDKTNDKYYEKVVEAVKDNRKDNKELIVKVIVEMLEHVL